jgi:hypothetical protein
MLDALIYLPERALEWLEQHSRWKDLKTLGSSNLVRASVLMPAFGYMLLLNENVHQYLTVKYDGWLLKYLPNVWRIWLLFYGSFFLAAATVLYSVFCPPEVKQYSSAFEMAEMEAKHQINLRQASVVQDRVKWLWDQMPLWMVPYFDANNINFKDEVYNREDPAGYLSQFCLLQWMILDMWHRGIRCCLFVLYAIGLALIAIPAVFTFLQVTWIPVKHLVR